MPRYPFDPPDEFNKVKNFLEEIDREMTNAINNNDKNMKDNEKMWPILKLNFKRTRYIYEMYKTKQISHELYKFCVQNFYCDHSLVCMWKKSGFENLCCLVCIQASGKEEQKICICRVPKRNVGQYFKCDACGCKGCGGQ